MNTLGRAFFFTKWNIKFSPPNHSNHFRTAPNCLLTLASYLVDRHKSGNDPPIKLSASKLFLSLHYITTLHHRECMFTCLVCHLHIFTGLSLFIALQRAKHAEDAMMVKIFVDLWRKHKPVGLWSTWKDTSKGNTFFFSSAFVQPSVIFHTEYLHVLNIWKHRILFPNKAQTRHPPVQTCLAIYSTPLFPRHIIKRRTMTRNREKKQNLENLWLLAGMKDESEW